MNFKNNKTIPVRIAVAEENCTHIIELSHLHVPAGTLPIMTKRPLAEVLEQVKVVAENAYYCGRHLSEAIKLSETFNETQTNSRGNLASFNTLEEFQLSAQKSGEKFRHALDLSNQPRSCGRHARGVQIISQLDQDTHNRTD